MLVYLNGSQLSSLWRRGKFFALVWGSVLTALLVNPAPGLAQSLSPQLDDFHRHLHDRQFVLAQQSQSIMRDEAVRHFGGMVLTQSLGRVKHFLGVGNKIRINSTLDWDSEGDFFGDWRISLPVWKNHRQAILLQPGVNFWQGHRDQERLDVNIGAVWRRAIGSYSMVGANMFYDINTDTEAGRLGSGLEVKIRGVSLALNGYLALSKWHNESVKYEQRIASGFDGTLGLHFGHYLTLRTSVGGWQNVQLGPTRDDEEKFDDLNLGIKVDAEIHLHPNISLHAAYDDETYGAGTSRYRTGLSLHWPARRRDAQRPGRPDLYALVAREYRLLYAERARAMPATSPQSPPQTAGQQGDIAIDIETMEESDADAQFTITARLESRDKATPVRPLAQDLVITLTPMDADADHGADYDLPESLTIPAGELQASDTLTLKGDRIAEGDEELVFKSSHNPIAPATNDSTLGDQSVRGQQDVEPVEQIHRHVVADDDSPAYLALIGADGYETAVTGGTVASVSEGKSIAMHYELRRASDDAPVLAAHDVDHELTHAPLTGSPVIDTHYNLPVTQIRLPQNQSQTQAFRLSAPDVPGSLDDSSKTLRLTATAVQDADWLRDKTHQSVITLGDNDALPHLLVNNRLMSAGVANSLSMRGQELADVSNPLRVPMTLTSAIAQADLTFDVAFVATSVANSSNAGQATNGADFRFAPADTIRFAKGSTEPQTAFAITILSDNVAEADESFALRFHNFATAGVTLDEVFRAPEEIRLSVTIPANDAITRFVAVKANGAALGDISVAENGGTGAIYYELRDATNKPVQTPQAVTINLSEIAGTGTPVRGTHYTLSATSLTIGAGASRSAALTMTGVADEGYTLVDNVDRRLALRAVPFLASSAIWYRMASGTRAITNVTLKNTTKPSLRINGELYIDSRLAPLPSYAIATKEAMQLRIPMVLSAPIPTTGINFKIETRKITAQASLDYTPILSRVEFDAGSTTPKAKAGLIDAQGHLLISILEDTIAEAAETFKITFSEFRASRGFVGQVFRGETSFEIIVTIAPNDAMTNLLAVDNTGAALSDISLAENGGTGAIYYELRDATNKPVQTPQAVTINLSETAVTGAPVRGTHYTLSATSLTIGAGASRSAALTVTGVADGAFTPSDHADRTLQLQATPALTNPPAWYRIPSNTRPTVAVTLQNTSRPALRINNAVYNRQTRNGQMNATEGAELRIPVSLTAPMSVPLSVGIRTLKGSAQATRDYTPFPGGSSALEFDAGSTIPKAKTDEIDAQGNILVSIVDDTIAENTETFTIEFTNFRVPGGNLSAVFDGATRISFSINIATSDQIASLVAVNGDGEAIDAASLSERSGQQQIYYELRDADGAKVQPSETISLTLSTINGTGAPEFNTHYRWNASSISFVALASRAGPLTITGLNDNEITANDRSNRQFILVATPSLARSASWYRIPARTTANVRITLVTD